PQAYNRYSYVLNNPIRYNDPTGHMCSDPGDPSPSCDGSGTPPPVTTPPPPPAPVVITNPDPLDDGLQQDDPTPAPTLGGPVCSGSICNPYYNLPIPTMDNSSQICSTNPDGCIIGGALLIVFTDLFVGLPAIAVIIITGGVTPPAIAAEVLETVVVLPVNILGIYLIAKGIKVKNEE
ncbi:MAG TPA: hypothetical protein VN653_17080, partial [Anaerolineales bacterium]|nr:hypothetical protein [Anaerolineales bacterium]